MARRRIQCAARWCRHHSSSASVHGFSLLELVIIVAIILTLSALSLPMVSKTLQSHRGVSDARRLASMVLLAHLRAAATFSKSRLNVNLAQGTIELQIYNKAIGDWSAEGGVQTLSPGVSFGFGAISTPAGGQAAIAQSPQIVFNSRGFPVDCDGCPTPAYAIYLTDGTGQYYAVTVSVSGLINIWQFDGTAWGRRN